MKLLTRCLGSAWEVPAKKQASTDPVPQEWQFAEPSGQIGEASREPCTGLSGSKLSDRFPAGAAQFRRTDGRPAARARVIGFTRSPPIAASLDPIGLRPCASEAAIGNLWMILTR